MGTATSEGRADGAADPGHHADLLLSFLGGGELWSRRQTTLNSSTEPLPSPTAPRRRP